MKYRSLRAIALIAPLVLAAGLGLAQAARVDTTLLDFFQPGTQPETLNTQIFAPMACTFCHSDFDPNMPPAPYDAWRSSIMAQAARDPVFYACLTVANQDAAFSGDLCIRCHSPTAWLEGRSSPTDASAFIDKDFTGVSCHVCHRMVDPIADPENPPQDAGILAALPAVNTNPHSGQYIIDPNDVRRGPYELVDHFYHRSEPSPFHREALICANCHDVSNPAYTRQMDGSYALNTLDTPHPTHDKFDEFPIERTYSEWAASSFALAPIDMGGRFGGELAEVSTCQDCHMPTQAGYGCRDLIGGQFREDLKIHTFLGANTWVLNAIRSLYPDTETDLTAEGAAAAIARNFEFLELASDLELSQEVTELRVRVTNQTGHKLPTGYPEGRRIWVNVRFLDAKENVIAERGAYDPNTAELTTADTKVYEAMLGLDATAAAAAGLPEGESFHFALNNKYFKDNRIPPRGFTNASFAAIQAAPVGYAYADGQYWDDTLYAIPPGARTAEVTVYYQATTKEYIEFLRDENTTDDRGQTAYDQWALHGKSAPAPMDHAMISLDVPGDLDADGDVDLQDLSLLLSAYGMTSGGDLDGDGDTDLTDLSILLGYYGA